MLARATLARKRIVRRAWHIAVPRGRWHTGEQVGLGSFRGAPLEWRWNACTLPSISRYAIDISRRVLMIAADAVATMDKTLPDDPAYDAMRRRYEELAELAGSLAHEIKNPLSVIHMNVELLREELVELDSPTRRRALDKSEIIATQCERMENLLRDFLRFARLRDLELTPGNLNEQVDRVLRAYAAQAHQDNVEVVRYLDADLPSILLHSDSLQAALMNLVKNALEAMPDGGQLVVHTWASGTGVSLDLIDTGCGMDENTALRMFEPFYSSKNGGSGLGLPTARKIIEAHGGRITVQSDVGRGTKFTLQFPVPPRLAGR